MKSPIEDYELIVRYFARALRPEELAELNGRLKTEVALQRTFAAILLQHLDLSELGRSQQSAIASPCPAPAGLTELPRPVEVPSSVRPWPAQWKWALSAAACLAVILGLALTTGLWTAGPQILDAIGTVQLLRAGHAPMPAAGESLKPGDRIVLGKESAATLKFPREATRLRLSDSADLRFEGRRGGKRFALDNGVLVAMVAPQRAGSPLTVTTPQAESTVIGTQFLIRAEPRGTRLEVWNGKVRIKGASDQARLTVAEGHFAFAATGLPTVTEELHGGVRWEFWGGIAGSRVGDLTSSPAYSQPSERAGRWPDLQLPTRLGDFYGLRLRTWLHVPADGEYHFWILGDDDAELWLSPDETPAHKTRICYTPEYADAGAWEKNPNQKSNAIRLSAGRQYYVEAVMKQGGGGECLAVAWSGPDGKRVIIPGSCLSPWPAEEAGQEQTR